MHLFVVVEFLNRQVLVAENELLKDLDMKLRRRLVA